MAKIARIWDGTEWVELASSLVNYPDQTGNSGKFLTTDGTSVSWSPISVTGTPLNVPDTIVSRDSDQTFDITGINFDTTDTITSASGRLFWDEGEGTLVVGLKGGNIDLDIGQENLVLVYNGTGSDLSVGNVVYISSSQGNRPSVSLSSAATESSSSKTLGMVSEPILNGSEGFVTTFGVVKNVNTSLFSPGDALWLSTTAGELTTTPPQSPNHLVFVGYCITSDANNGRIFVEPQNGYEIEELHNVLISSPQNNNLLIYNSSTQLWENYNPLLLIQSIDGVNSGIDADLLDGQQGSYYLDTSSSPQTKEGDLTITGNLTVNGTTTTFNSVTISIDDKNLELGSVDTPTDVTADGGGITLKGDTDKTINWVALTSSWTLSENLDLAQGKVIKINGSPILSATQYAGNAQTVTNGVYTTEFYDNPDWIDTISWDKIIGTPTTLSGYGITDTLATLTYLGLENVENVSLSEWSGNTFINSVGTITVGTWNATKIDALYIDDAIARLDSPTFGGTVSLPSGTSIGTVTSSEISYLTGVSSNIQTQLDGKLSSSVASTTYAPINSPSFSGTVDFSSSSVIGIDLLPSQTNNAGKYLSTDGTNALWEELNGSTYSADAPTSPSVGDIWIESDVDIDAFDPRIYIRWNKVLSSSIDTFSGVGSNGVALEYTPGYEQVYLNGVLLLRGTDYTASDGLTVVLSSPAVTGDVIEIIAQNVVSIANTYTQTQVDDIISDIETMNIMGAF